MCKILKLKINILIFFLIAVLVFLISCSKKEPIEQKALSTTPQISELSEEIISLLDKCPDVLEYIYILKKFKVPYIDLIPKPAEFEQGTDRKKMLMRFGMLSADIAYEKIVGSKTQLPEYEQLYQKYVKDLNIGSFINKSYNEYVNKMAGKNLDDELLIEMNDKIRREGTELINNVKKLDEEFLVYYSLGVLNEITYIYFLLIDSDKTGSLEKKLAEYLESINDVVSNEFVLKLCNTKNYADYALMYKPAAEIMYQKSINSEPYTTIENLKMYDAVNNFRKEILK